MSPSAFSPYRLLSRGGAAARLSIFIFHRVLPAPDALLPWEPDAARFDRLVAFIARHFRVLRLADAARLLGAGRLPSAAACITFDDGYADNFTVAAPILRRHGVSATFFIATGYIDGGRMFNDTVIESFRQLPAGPLDWRDLGLAQLAISDDASRVRACEQALSVLKYLPAAERERRCGEIARRAGLASASALMMTREQVVGLRAMGMDIGGHTVTHPILRNTDDATAWQEIAGGRDTLRDWLGEAPAVFAYPNGVPDEDYGARDVALARRAGFRAAVSTAPGSARPGSDAFQLPRFTPWDRSLPRFGLRCAINIVAAEPASRVAA